MCLLLFTCSEHLLEDDPMLDEGENSSPARHNHVYNIHGIAPGTVRRRRRLFSSIHSLRYMPTPSIMPPPPQ